MDFVLDLIDGVSGPGAGTSLTTLLLSLLMACAIGQLIGWVYMWTHASPSYSKTFASSLVILPVIVALMMVLMSGSTAIAFGLLAVFAVVRFRNVLKDTRDTTFVLWAIIEGMGAGTLHFVEAICGTVVIGLMLAYLRISDFGSRNRFDSLLSLDLAGVSGDFDDLLAPVLKRHASRWKRTGEQHLTRTGSNISYQLLLRDPSRSEELRKDLLLREEIEQLSLFVHDDQWET